MIDHVIIRVSDLERSVEFYEKALKPLGYEIGLHHPGWGCGFQVGGKPDFWIAKAKENEIVCSVHIAFAAPNRAKVDLWYDTALQAGGRDNGEPGPRKQYHPNYYGAFVLDPDGHNIEAVCHLPE